MKDKILVYIGVGIVISLFLFYNLYTPAVHVYGPNGGSKRGSKGKTIFILGSVHGNEPSGTKACYHLMDYLKNNPPKHKVMIMPMPNPLGYYLDSRYQMKPFNRDINRNFNNIGKDRVSSIILEYVRQSDFIVDLHEGYEYHKRFSQSMGSSIIPNKGKIALKISNVIVNTVNETIQDEDKKFVVSNFYDKEDCYLPDSLACYCNRHKKDYISIETTGLLTNQQPIQIRVNQHYVLLKGIINYI